MSSAAAVTEIPAKIVSFSTANSNDSLVEATASIIAAFLENNACEPQNLVQLITQTRQALQGASGQAFGQVSGEIGQQASSVKPTPAVDPKKSVHKDYIICLEDGQKVTMLKRYISKRFGLTPQAYREKWGLPKDYPMTCPSYSARRAEVAKRTGLGLGNTGRRKGSTKKA